MYGRACCDIVDVVERQRREERRRESCPAPEEQRAERGERAIDASPITTDGARSRSGVAPPCAASHGSRYANGGCW